jgi:hypothetical protein
MTSEGTVLVVQDVTERRNAQLEINRMARFDSVTELPIAGVSRSSSLSPFVTTRPRVPD